MTLKEAIEFIANNKHLSAIDAKRTGETTFAECDALIKSKLLDNDTNRDEELDTVTLYSGKVNHTIRYVSGVSEKGPLMATVLRDRAEKTAYIRDNGTMFGLCFGEYFHNRVLSGNEWLKICDSIIDEYDVDDKDAKFILLIKNYFNTLSQSELDVKRSFCDVVSSSEEIHKMFYNSKISFVVNLWKRKQHQKDMINTNLQPNPWIAYNHYMTIHKDTNAYRTQFLGKDLLKWVQGKEGLSAFSRGKLMNTYTTAAQEKKVNSMIPLIISYGITHFVDSVDELNKAYSMIVNFSKHKDKEVSDYWTELFGKVVENTTYKEMQDFYDKQYLKAFTNNSWNNITKAINTLVKKKCKGTETTAMQGLHIKKFDTGFWFLCVSLWFKNKNKKVGIDKIIDTCVLEYVKLINGNVNLGDGTTVKLYDYFGNEASVYKSACAKARMDKVFQYVTKELSLWIINRAKDRDIEAELRNSALKKMSMFVEEEGIFPVLYAYPLSTDDVVKFNIITGDGLHWLHKSPHGNGGNAKDGFLGLTDDNLTGNVKYKNWNISSNNQYWEMLIERNEEKLKTTKDKTISKNIQRTISTLELMLEIDLTV